MSSFKYIHLRLIAELEYQFRLAQVKLQEHLELCTTPDKVLRTELYTAEMNLAKHTLDVATISR